MPFETRNVEDEHRKKKRNDSVKKALVITSGLHFLKQVPFFLSQVSRKIWVVIASILICLMGGVFAYSYVSDNSEEVLKGGLTVAAAVLGEDLKKNEANQTNILLLGSGGENHEGGFLTDSIIIATLNFETNGVSMISVPRDLYVKYSVEGSPRKGKINRVFMESMEYWKHRLDTVPEQIEASEKNLRTELEEILGDEIHYTVYIDFQGFVQVVDLLGGIEVDVEKRIYDDQYPGPNHSYRTFILPEGDQILSGETALKYVRSRHGNAGGDFGRSYRQKKALLALKDKALESGVLSSPAKIKSILGIVSDHFWTSLSWQEMLSLAEFGQAISSENISIGGIQDLTNPNKEWFLYTPPRDLFGGQAVLLPCRINSKNPWSDIQHYYSLLTNAASLVNGDTSVSLFNTTKTPGLASELEIILSRYSIDSEQVSNADTRTQSIIEYVQGEETEQMARVLEEWLGIPTIGLSREQMEDIYWGESDADVAADGGSQNGGAGSDGVATVNTSSSVSPVVQLEKPEISDIMIYLGEDYQEDYRDSIVWYRQCL